MKPILFDESEINFTSNGIGRLSDAVDCKVREVKNGAYTLTMTYPVKGRWFNELKVGRIIYAMHDNSGIPQPFDISHVSKPSKGRVSVTANHISYRLSGVVATPFGVVDLTPVSYFQGLSESIIGNCPFSFYTDVDDVEGTIVSTMDNAKPASVRALLGSDARTNFLEVFGVNGAAFKWDKFNVNFLKNRGADNGVSFRRGKNVVQLSEDVDNSQFVTAVVPFWRGYEPITGEQVQVDLSDRGWVVKSAIADSYPYQHTVVYDMSDVWEQPPLKEELIEGAQQYLQILTYNHFHQRTTYAVDLTYTGTATDALQDVNLCDTVSLIDEELDILVKLEVVQTVYDCLREKYVSIEVGSKSQTISDVMRLQNKIYIEKIKSQQEQTSDLAKKTNVTRYVVPASANTNANANANVQTRGATRATTTEYDEDGNEIEKIATINRQDIYAHVGGGGSGSSAKILTFNDGAEITLRRTDYTYRRLYADGDSDNTQTVKNLRAQIDSMRIYGKQQIYAPNATSGNVLVLNLRIKWSGSWTIPGTGTWQTVTDKIGYLRVTGSVIVVGGVHFSVADMVDILTGENNSSTKTALFNIIGLGSMQSGSSIPCTYS